MNSIDCISNDKYHTVFGEIVKVADINIIKVVGCLVARVVNALTSAVGVGQCNGFYVIQQADNAGLLDNLTTSRSDVNKACICLVVIIAAALPVINLSVIWECYQLVVIGITLKIKLACTSKVGQHCTTHEIARCVALIVSRVKQC